MLLYKNIVLLSGTLRTLLSTNIRCIRTLLSILAKCMNLGACISWSSQGHQLTSKQMFYLSLLNKGRQGVVLINKADTVSFNPTSNRTF